MSTGKFIKSFYYAGRGIINFWKKERNIKVQTAIGLITLFLAYCFPLSFAERLVIIFFIFFIPGLEILNGIIEELANLMNLRYEQTTYLRDLAAGLVLWFSGLVLLAGIMIFGKYIL